MAHGRAGLPHRLPDNPHLCLLRVTLTGACELAVELDAAARLNVRAGPGWREDPAPVVAGRDEGAGVVVRRQPWSSCAAPTSCVGTSQTRTNLSVCAGSHRGRGRHVFTTPHDGTAPTGVRAVGTRQRRGPFTGRPVSGTARTQRHGDASAGPTLTGG